VSATVAAGALELLGWTLVHFLWQGALIAGLLELALLDARGRSAERRYLLRLSALVAMAAAPALTFWILRGDPVHVPAPEWGAAQGTASPSPWWEALAGRTMVWVVVAWSLGATALCLRLLLGWRRVRCLQRATRKSTLPRHWQSVFDRLSDALCVRAAARVIDSAMLAAPTVIGWLRPVVLVPARVLTGMTAEQIEALLAHELAHVRRHDYLVNLLQCLLEALLFYHPAVWWVSAGIRREREYCCDDVALRVTKDGVSFARALASLEAWRGESLQVGVSTTGGSLMQRIQRLIGIDARSPSRAGGVLRAIAVLVVAGSFGASALGLGASPRLEPCAQDDGCEKCRELQRALERHGREHETAGVADEEVRIVYEDRVRAVPREPREIREPREPRASRLRRYVLDEMEEIDEIDEIEEHAEEGGRREAVLDLLPQLRLRTAPQIEIEVHSRLKGVQEHLREALERHGGQLGDLDARLELLPRLRLRTAPQIELQVEGRIKEVHQRLLETLKELNRVSELKLDPALELLSQLHLLADPRNELRLQPRLKEVQKSLHDTAQVHQELLGVLGKHVDVTDPLMRPTPPRAELDELKVELHERLKGMREALDRTRLRKAELEEALERLREVRQRHGARDGASGHDGGSEHGDGDHGSQPRKTFLHDRIR